MVGHEDYVVVEALGRSGFIQPFCPRFAGNQANSEPELPTSHRNLSNPVNELEKRHLIYEFAGAGVSRRLVTDGAAVLLHFWS
jgi:hypothetical protein